MCSPLPGEFDEQTDGQTDLFFHKLDGLRSGATYYARAYAQNAEGVAYGVAERTALRTDFLSQGLAGYVEAGATVRVQEVRASPPL